MSDNELGQLARNIFEELPTVGSQGRDLPSEVLSAVKASPAFHELATSVAEAMGESSVSTAQTWLACYTPKLLATGLKLGLTQADAPEKPIIRVVWMRTEGRDQYKARLDSDRGLHELGLTPFEAIRALLVSLAADGKSGEWKAYTKILE